MLKTVPRANGDLSFQLTAPSQAYQLVSKVIHGAVPLIPSAGKYNISISHNRKFIWFRVAKVCTRSIFDLFETAGITLDAEHPMFCHYPIRRYDDYYKFSFVRNPWDRIVSAWKNKVVESNSYKLPDTLRQELQNYERYLEYIAEEDIINSDHHVMPQYKLIDLNNVDYVGRFENFESDIQKVIGKIGITETGIGHKNATYRQPSYAEYYNQRTCKMIEQLYGRDISIFNYKFD